MTAKRELETPSNSKKTNKRNRPLWDEWDLDLSCLNQNKNNLTTSNQLLADPNHLLSEQTNNHLLSPKSLESGLDLTKPAPKKRKMNDMALYSQKKDPYLIMPPHYKHWEYKKLSIYDKAVLKIKVESKGWREQEKRLKNLYENGLI